MRMLRVVLVAGISAAAWSQTLVEYGLGAAAAGTAGAGGAGSRGISGVFSNLTKTLNSTAEAGTAASKTQPAKAATAKVKTAATAAAAQPTVAEAATPPAPPKPVVVYEDPAGIKTGMEQTELLSRFGEPVAKITTGSDAESLTYDSKDRVFEVEMRAGKVYSVQPKSKPRQAGIVLLQ